MKRLLIVLCVAALLATIPLARIATAKTNKKQPICHVTFVLDVGVLPFVLPFAFGRVMEVPTGAALEAHLDHGDRMDFTTMTEEQRLSMEAFYGINLRNANAHFLY